MWILEEVIIKEGIREVPANNASVMGTALPKSRQSCAGSGLGLQREGCFAAGVSEKACASGSLEVWSSQGRGCSVGWRKGEWGGRVVQR